MICRGCQKDKHEEDFPVRNDRSGRLRPYCQKCSNEIERIRYDTHKRTQPFKLKCSRAKNRARNLDIPFDLTPEYLEEIWTGKCAINGTDIVLYGDRLNENTAELDRIEPQKGYVQGNVAFLCRRFNRIKNNATSKELIKIGEWLNWKLRM